jgi:hypothetical protein
MVVMSVRLVAVVGGLVPAMVAKMFVGGAMM